MKQRQGVSNGQRAQDNFECAFKLVCVHGFPDGSVAKNLLAGDTRDAGSITWNRKWQPTPVFLPGKSHGQRKPGGLQSMGSQKAGHN